MNGLDEFDMECATARERQLMRRVIAAEKNVAAITKAYQDVSAALAACERRLESAEAAIEGCQDWIAWKEKEERDE